MQRDTDDALNCAAQYVNWQIIIELSVYLQIRSMDYVDTACDDHFNLQVVFNAILASFAAEARMLEATKPIDTYRSAQTKQMKFPVELTAQQHSRLLRCSEQPCRTAATLKPL